MARYTPALLALLTLFCGAPRTAAAKDNAAQVAAKMAEALSKLDKFTVNLKGSVEGGAAGMSMPMQGPQSVRGTFALDRRKSDTWKAVLQLVLPMSGSGKPLEVQVVHRGPELFLSTVLPIPGMTGGKAMAFRVPAPESKAKTGAPSDWAAKLEQHLKQAQAASQPANLQVENQVLTILVDKKDGSGKFPMHIEFDKFYLPTRFRSTGGTGAVDVQVISYKRDVADTTLPLPVAQYSAVSPGMLKGMAGMFGGGGGSAAPKASPFRAPSVSPFGGNTKASPFAGGAKPSPFSGQPKASPFKVFPGSRASRLSPPPSKAAPNQPIPIPGPAAAGTGAPGGMPDLSTLIQGFGKTLSSSMAGQGNPGSTPSDIPGLNLSPGTRNLLEHMRKLRTGEVKGKDADRLKNDLMQKAMQLPALIQKLKQDKSARDEIAAQTRPALQALMQKMQQLKAPGANGQPSQGSQMLSGLTQMLQKFGQNVQPSAGIDPSRLEEYQRKAKAAAQAFQGQKIKDLEKAGFKTAIPSGEEAAKRLQDLMQRLKRTVPTAGDK